MKNRQSTYFLVGLLLLIFSCESKQENIIQTQVNKIVGQWKLNSFETANATSNQWKGLVKSGEFKFVNCRAKSVIKDNSYCKGGVDLNGEVYDLTYRFDDYFVFNFSLISKDGSGKIVFSNDDALLMALMNGQWELTVSNNTLISKQIANPRNPDLLSSFTATRQ